MSNEEKLKWIDFDKNTISKYLRENDLIDKELIFKERNNRDQIRHHIGRGFLNNQNEIILIIGSRFAFDFREGSILSFAQIDHLLD